MLLLVFLKVLKESEEIPEFVLTIKKMFCVDSNIQMLLAYHSCSWSY